MEKPLTKIVATLGPASAGKDNIRALAQAGVNVFRLNFSHGTHDFHRENFQYIREIAKEMHTPLLYAEGGGTAIIWGQKHA